MEQRPTLVREARPGDAEGIAKVHVASWRSTYPTMLPAPFLLSMTVESATRRWDGLLRAPSPGEGTFVVADARGPVVGFGTCGPRRGRIEGYDGEFYALYLLDEAQGRGDGRRLMAAMAERLLAGGAHSAVVWCLRDNPSRWFYERMGGQRVADRPIRFAGADMVEIAYGWRDLLPLARLSAGGSVL